MEKINFEEFKEECKKFQGKNINIKTEKIFEMVKNFDNASFDVNLSYILIKSKDDFFRIDTNYVSNFYKEERTVKCEIAEMMDIIILAK